MKRLATLLVTLVAIAVLSRTTQAQSNPCLQGFQFENISSVSNGSPSVAGMPAALSWVQTNVGQRDDVFARSVLGALVHFYRLAGGGWTGENLSNMTGGSTIRTDPVAVLGRQQVRTTYSDRHDVFAVNNDNHLIHYWWSEIPPSAWNGENLTTDYAGPAVWSKPIVWNSYYRHSSGERRLRQDVHSVNDQGDLVHYWWKAETGWRHTNVTQAIGGARFNRFSTLSLITESPTQPPTDYHHIFGHNANGHLLHYWREPSGWRWANVTVVNGQQVHPMIASGVSTVDHNGTIDGVNTARLNVFGFLANQMIRYWSWNLLGPWSSENATQTFGFLGSSGTITGTPAAGTSRQTTVPEPTSTRDVLVRHDVYARDQNKHLIHYWAAQPWPDFKASGGSIPWAPGENLTTKIDGLFFETDPIVVINLADLYRPEHYVFGRGGQSAVLYCWTVGNGWTSGTLTANSSPMGEFINGSPAVSAWSTVGLSVYAPSLQNELLHYWKQ